MLRSILRVPSLSSTFVRNFYGARIQVTPNLVEPSASIPGKHPKWAYRGEDMFSQLCENGNVYVQGGVGTPHALLNELKNYVMDRGLRGITLHQFFPRGKLSVLEPECSKFIRINSLFATRSCRDAINNGEADFVPISLSEIPHLFRRQHFTLDLALIQVSPPNQHGFCCLCAGVDINRAAIQNSRIVVAQVNPNTPTTFGDTTVHISKIDYIFYDSSPLQEFDIPEFTEVDSKVGKIIAENLIDDGDTCQFGIGRIPYATSMHLKNHKNLGIHTDMLSTEVVNLWNAGCISNSTKNVRRGRIVASFVVGKKELFDFIHENPSVNLCDIAWTNAPEVIARNPNVAAVNACLETDLGGQIVSSTYGNEIRSGVGGQEDFIRGASWSEGGKPILCMRSLTPSGESAIRPFLTKGTAVVCSRALVRYIVTEYGIAYLFGKNLRQRAHALIKIAHPDFREELEKAAFDILKTMPSPD
uniref:Acetyl-CoA hydrolase n=1 Tax=Mesocestoides corti TaxID=53468 RepID=A0A5K3ERJ6_MESCO